MDGAGELTYISAFDSLLTSRPGTLHNAGRGWDSTERGKREKKKSR